MAAAWIPMTMRRGVAHDVHDARDLREAYGAQPKSVAGVRCPVCGSDHVELDEVVDAGPLLLGGCTHCEHRWTSRLAAPQAGAIRARVIPWRDAGGALQRQGRRR